MELRWDDADNRAAAPAPEVVAQWMADKVDVACVAPEDTETWTAPVEAARSAGPQLVTLVEDLPDSGRVLLVAVAGFGIAGVGQGGRHRRIQHPVSRARDLGLSGLWRLVHGDAPTLGYWLWISSSGCCRCGDGRAVHRLSRSNASGAALARLATIDLSNRHPGLRECAIEVACDVDNPLCGPCGASRTYGPQKGATPEMVDELDAALRHFGEVIEAETGVSVLEAPGAGAAGGLGAGLLAFAGGVLRPGVELVAEACSLMARIAGAELVITGEGRIDSQTPFGKTPAGVAKVARERGIPVVAIAGSLGPGYETVYECGIDAVFSIASGPMSLAAAMERAPELLAATAEAVARVWHAGRREAGPM